MNKEGYVAIYGSIDVAMMQVVQILHEYTFAMVPEENYKDWLKLDDFVKEIPEEAICDDGVARSRLTTYFETKHGEWKVTSYRCAHPKDPQGTENWHFIDNVCLDDEEVACSLITIEEFNVLLKKRSQPK